MLQKGKNCAFVGAPFCGAPVWPNMLNMPKSASVHGQHIFAMTVLYEYLAYFASLHVCLVLRKTIRLCRPSFSYWINLWSFANTTFIVWLQWRLQCSVSCLIIYTLWCFIG